MSQLDNLIHYFDGEDYNKETIVDDFDYYYANYFALSMYHPYAVEYINNCLLYLINDYRNRFDMYLRATFNREFDDLTRQYILNAEVPYEINVISPIESYMLKRITKKSDIIDALVEINRCNTFNNHKLNDVKFHIADSRVLINEINENDNLSGAYHYQYFNNFNEKPEYTEDDYNDMLTEMERNRNYLAQINTKPTKFEKWDYNNLVCEYGEHKVTEYLKSKYPDYKFNRVSLMGNGYGYDTAMYKDLSKVIGVEIKSTYNDPTGVDLFTLTGNESDWLKYDSSIMFIMIRYSIKDDMIYIIYRNNGDYICEDKNGVRHFVERTDDHTFKIVKTIEDKEERGRHYYEINNE